mmetsp:Transcript_115089/g.311018  ORF Transcript_115089/g.311018 Transcript_115089/m.311018 type:complete len:208 (+) Transcript_115089:489-1112(+)
MLLGTSGALRGADDEPRRESYAPPDPEPIPDRRLREGGGDFRRRRGRHPHEVQLNFRYQGAAGLGAADEERAAGLAGCICVARRDACGRVRMLGRGESHASWPLVHLVWQRIRARAPMLQRFDDSSLGVGVCHSGGKRAGGQKYRRSCDSASQESHHDEGSARPLQLRGDQDRRAGHGSVELALYQRIQRWRGRRRRDAGGLRLRAG